MGLRCFACQAEKLKPMMNSKTGEFWAACDSCGRSFPSAKDAGGAVQHSLWLQPRAWDGFQPFLEEVKGHLEEVVDRKAMKSLVVTFDLINQVLAHGPAQAPEAWVKLCQSYPTLPRPLQN